MILALIHQAIQHLVHEQHREMILLCRHIEFTIAHLNPLPYDWSHGNQPIASIRNQNNTSLLWNKSNRTYSFIINNWISHTCVQPLNYLFEYDFLRWWVETSLVLNSQFIVFYKMNVVSIGALDAMMSAIQKDFPSLDRFFIS